MHTREAPFVLRNQASEAAAERTKLTHAVAERICAQLHLHEQQAHSYAKFRLYEQWAAHMPLAQSELCTLKHTPATHMEASPPPQPPSWKVWGLLI